MVAKHARTHMERERVRRLERAASECVSRASKMRQRMCTNPYCLGEYWCFKWDCCGTLAMEPEPKRKKLDDRFSKPTSPSTMSRICEGYVPPNTGKATKWALKVFEQWRNAASEEQCPDNLLLEPSAAHQLLLRLSWHSLLQGFDLEDILSAVSARL